MKRGSVGTMTREARSGGGRVSYPKFSDVFDRFENEKYFFISK